jgi:hypothetical protein
MAKRLRNPEERPVIRIKRITSGLTTSLAAAIVWLAMSSSASAQYGPGFGFGELMFGFRNVPSPTDFLNQHSLKAAARGMQGPTQNRAYGPGSNSFHNHSRDPGFVSTGELSRRRFPVGSRTEVASNTRPDRTDTRPAAPASKPAVPALASFFDAMLKLAWPSESPTAGELGAKRAISDEASLAVLEETRRYQSASLSTVTFARQKLLDYGQPALQEIRRTSTAPIADAFHRFMLSLYESLAQASRAN